MYHQQALRQSSFLQNMRTRALAAGSASKLGVGISAAVYPAAANIKVDLHPSWSFPERSKMDALGKRGRHEGT